jgi:hypothetical protein
MPVIRRMQRWEAESTGVWSLPKACTHYPNGYDSDFLIRQLPLVNSTPRKLSRFKQVRRSVLKNSVVQAKYRTCLCCGALSRADRNRLGDLHASRLPKCRVKIRAESDLLLKRLSIGKRKSVQVTRAT